MIQTKMRGKHQWVVKTFGKITLTCCQKCGIVRNDTSDTRQCKGIVRVELRGPMRMSTTREALAAKYRQLSPHSHKRVETALAIKAATTAELQEHVMLEKMAREIQEAVEFEPMLGDVAFLKDMGLGA